MYWLCIPGKGALRCRIGTDGFTKEMMELPQKDPAKQGKRKPDAVCFMNMCMISDAHGNVLALDKVNDSYTGTTFPGGHVEENEGFQESVIREVREETGLEIRNPKLCGVYHWMRDGIHHVVFLYSATEFAGELKSSEEGRVYWISPEDFRKKDLAGGMECVLQIMESPQLNECWMRLQDGKYAETLY